MIAESVVCHICRAAPVERFHGFERLRRVASDGRPWPEGGGLGSCPACGIVQKPLDSHWREETRAIYAQYHIYHQSIDGVEQSVFDQQCGSSQPRSGRILDAVTRMTGIPDRGSMLDVGCGNGATLRAFSAAFPAWDLNGLEPNLRSEGALKSIPGIKRLYASDLADVAETFDLISIIHTLEHVENPIEFLRQVRGRLGNNGMLLIQVPYFPDNPIDLLIADHCTHFTLDSLRHVLEAASFSPLEIRQDVIFKEITAVARAMPEGVPISPARPVLRAESAVEEGLNWIERLLEQAKSVSGSDTFGLFGTSIAANWLMGYLKPRIRFFVDEDPGRAGTTYEGVPVFRPADVPAGSDVFMVLPYTLAAQITARVSREEIRFHLPPPYQSVMRERPFVPSDRKAASPEA